MVAMEKIDNSTEIVDDKVDQNGQKLEKIDAADLTNSLNNSVVNLPAQKSSIDLNPILTEVGNIPHTYEGFKDLIIKSANSLNNTLINYLVKSGIITKSISSTFYDEGLKLLNDNLKDSRVSKNWLGGDKDVRLREIYKELREQQDKNSRLTIDNSLLASTLNINDLQAEDCSFINDVKDQLDDQEKITDKVASTNLLSDSSYLLSEDAFGKILNFGIYSNRPDLPIRIRQGADSGWRKDFDGNDMNNKSCEIKDYQGIEAPESISFVKQLCGVDNLSKDQWENLAKKGEFVLKEIVNVDQKVFDAQIADLKNIYPGSNIELKNINKDNKGTIEISYSKKSMYNYLVSQRGTNNNAIINGFSGLNVGTQILGDRETNEANKQIIAKSLSPDLPMNKITNPNLKLFFKNQIDSFISNNKETLNSLYGCNTLPNPNNLHYTLKTNSVILQQTTGEYIASKDFNTFVSNLNNYINSGKSIYYDGNNKCGHLYGVENVNGMWNVVYYTSADYDLAEDNKSVNLNAREALKGRWNAYIASNTIPKPIP